MSTTHAIPTSHALRATHAAHPAKVSTPAPVAKGDRAASKADVVEHKGFHISTKVVDNIGRVASVLSVIMYVSYITQIANNLGGHPGTPWQPLAAFFNCVMWTLYGWLKPKKDIPIIVANVPGIFLAAITVITSFI